MSRYRLQEAFQPIGPESTSQFAKSHVVIVGCGATGSHVADALARMGVHFLTLIDPDVVERENLHRQLYCEADCKASKATALANHVFAVNSEVFAYPIVDRVVVDNIAKLIPGTANLILDATDNMETRWVINEFAVKHRIPWIYTGVGRSKGMSMAIVPGKTACLRCLFSPSEKQDKPSGGIFPPAVAVMANVQATMAIKILVGWLDDIGVMEHFNAWTGEWMKMNTKPKPDCPVCSRETDSIDFGETK